MLCEVIWSGAAGDNEAGADERAGTVVGAGAR